ncbi:hypothetical protein BZG32_12685 [Enterococcus faecalis]|jgi:hypothetical protein|nr:hypothetical protein BZG32_12685 [Enterococcus faecalis]EFM71964.1 hypothetical protein HMPREF9515_02858 [Enterococcus faecalis TX0860]
MKWKGGLMDLRNELKKIRVSIIDNSEEQVKSELYGIFSSLILSKKIAPKNSDLKGIMSELNFSFKEYVFKSRTILLSRIIRAIEKMDEKEVSILIEKLINFIEVDDILNQKTKVSYKKKKKNIFDDIFNQLG